MRGIKKKHPDIIAWEIYAEDNPESFDPETLGGDKIYLRNRLQLAFYAGIEIAEKRLKVKQLKTKIK